MAQSAEGPEADLFDAAWEGDLARVEALLADGADVNSVNQYGNTPLMEAVLGNRVAVVRALIAAGADVNVRLNGGHTPLTLAVQLPRVRVARCLLAAGANVDATTDDGASVLMWAVGSPDSTLGVLELVLSYGADLRVRDKHNGLTALEDEERHGGRPKVIEALRRAEAAAAAAAGLGQRAVDRRRGVGDPGGGPTSADADEKGLGTRIHQDVADLGGVDLELPPRNSPARAADLPGC